MGIAQLAPGDVRAEDRQRARRLLCGERRFAHSVPELRVVREQPLEAESPAGAGGDAQGHHRRLDDEGAAAAHRVEQRLLAVPAGERQDPRREVLLERRLAALGAVAALVQRLPGGIQIERDLLRVEERRDAHVRSAGVDVRAPAALGAEPIAHRILDAQRDEFQAPERRADRGDVDAYPAPDREPALPGDAVGGVVDVLLVPVGRARKLHQHARGEARMQVGATARGKVAFEAHAARDRPQRRRADLAQLFDEQGLEPARTGGEIRLR